MSTSGPRVRIIDTPTFYSRSEWNVQEKPYVRRLPYKAVRAVRSSSELLKGGFSSSLDLVNPSYPQFQAAVERARNKAYSDFVEKAKVTAIQMGEALAERQKTWEMMIARIGQLTRFARALRKGDVRTAARTLGVAKPRSWRRGAKSFGAQFLEFHFGWEPLVMDIYNASTKLGDVPSGRVVGRGLHPFGVASTSRQPWWPWSTTYQSFDGAVRCQIIADVAVSDPGLFLVNRAGLSNPASLLWNLSPFTWLLGWFTNVEDWLNQFTDLSGLDVRNSATTISSRFTYYWSNWYGDSSWEPKVVWDRVTSNAVTRAPGIATPTLRFDIPDRLSVARGLTAISVLLQHLRK